LRLRADVRDLEQMTAAVERMRASSVRSMAGGRGGVQGPIGPLLSPGEGVE